MLYSKYDTDESKCKSSRVYISSPTSLLLNHTAADHRSTIVDIPTDRLLLLLFLYEYTKSNGLAPYASVNSYSPKCEIRHDDGLTTPVRSSLQTVGRRRVDVNNDTRNLNFQNRNSSTNVP